ncbi:MAG: PqqD family protein [Deltaproteobacteria bacterium]|nr:PqqD family protein [Deltaproteobacteria bacterium]
MVSGPLLQARPDVAFRRLGDECLLVPIRRRPDDKLAVFALNRVAALVWSELQRPSAPAAIIDLVIRRFEVSREVAARDVLAFIAELRTAELVREANDAPVP